MVEMRRFRISSSLTTHTHFPAFTMDTPRLLDLVRCLLATPTGALTKTPSGGNLIQLAQCPHVHVERDDFGNIMARYQSGPAPRAWRLRRTWITPRMSYPW